MAKVNISAPGVPDNAEVAPTEEMTAEERAAQGFDQAGNVINDRMSDLSAKQDADYAAFKQGDLGPMADTALNTALGTMGTVSAKPFKVTLNDSYVKPIYTTAESAEAQYAPGAMQKIRQILGISSDSPNLSPEEILKAREFLSNSNITHLEQIKMSDKASRVRQTYADGGDVIAPPMEVQDPSTAHMVDSAPTTPVQEAPPPTSDVNVINPEGELVSISPHQLEDALGSGFQLATPEHVQAYKNQQIYGTPAQMGITAAEGLARGVVGPFAPATERALGGSTEAMRGRQEANPWVSGISEATGLLGSAVTGVGEGALLAKAGAKAAQMTGLGLEGASLASKVAAAAIKGGAENAAYQTLDETSKMIMEDPDQSVGAAAAHVGLAGLLGVGVGGGIGAISPLWEATLGSKTGQMVADFKGRMNYHATTPDPLSAVTDEANSYYNAIRGAADDVYGPTGLKAQDIAKAMPEMSNKMTSQVSDTVEGVQKQLKKMAESPHRYPERLAGKLEEDLQGYLTDVTSPEAKPADLFNATQTLKQKLQGYSQFDKMITPVHEAYDFIKITKDLGRDLRLALEDSSVWGKAGERQQAINKAYTEFRDPLKQFESKFTTKVVDPETGHFTQQIDPGKMATYMNQLGKPNAEIKQSAMKTFLDAAGRYEKVINDIHGNIGIESPIQPQSLSALRQTLNEVTPGAKLADLLVKKGMSQIAGQGLGAAIGATAGHAVGAPGIGALVGQHALGPFLSSVMPALTKPFASEVTHAVGAKSAIDYSMAVAKGVSLMNKGAKSVFKPGASVLADSHLPTQRDRDKLDKSVQAVMASPDSLTTVGGKTGHYLPDHGTALATTASNATNYLAAQRPKTTPANPLDSKRTPSSVEKAQYQRTLDIAQQPLVILDHIKKGTITPKDIQDLRSMYPGMYKTLTQKINNEMINTLDKGESIPYKTRVGVSMYLGMPVDSTMTPQSITSAQPKPPAPQPQSKGAKHSMTALNKLPGMYSTSDQSRAKREGKD